MQGFDWQRYAVGGAAARPDSFSGLNPDYAYRVAQLIQAAEQELGPRALTITSAYRSPELQAQLFDGAVAKYGSEAAARRWVAPPGRSRHNMGLAVDFADASGRMLRDPNSREAQWIKANAGRFGLDVPMSWEPWQVELAGSRGGSAGGGAEMRPGLLSMSTSGSPEQQEPMTFGQRLKQNWQSGELLDNLALAFNSMRMRPDPNIAAIVQGRQDRRQQKETANRTAAWLEAQGRPDLAAAVMSGVIGGGDAFTMMNQQPEDNRTALQQNVEFLMAQGYSMEDALKAVQGASGGTTVNVGPSGIDYGSAPKDMAWARNPDGSVRLDERGAPIALPIQGTQLFVDQQAAGDKREQKAENEQTYGDAAVSAIDALIGPDGNGGMIDDGSGFFNLSNAGVAGKRMADWGIDQGAVNVRNTLSTVTSNIAFSRLQAMRDASATGGALGSVTENELAMLMNSLGAVQQDTDPKLLRENLKVIRDIWTKIQRDPVARRAYAAAGATGAAGAATVAPQGDGFSVTGQF